MTHTRFQAALFFAAMTLMPAPVLSAWAPTHAAVEESPVVEDDCRSSPDLSSKEACYARLPPSVIEECESFQMFACAPYRDMHLAQASHAAALEDLATRSNAVSATYAESDPAYAGEFADRLRDAESAWRAWRDAECALAPLLDGMSRREFDGLIEACRVEQTRSRVDLLRSRATSMEEAGR